MGVSSALPSPCAMRSVAILGAFCFGQAASLLHLVENAFALESPNSGLLQARILHFKLFSLQGSPRKHTRDRQLSANLLQETLQTSCSLEATGPSPPPRPRPKLDRATVRDPADPSLLGGLMQISPSPNGTHLRTFRKTRSS